MWIYSFSMAKAALMLVLTLYASCSAEKQSYNADDFTTLLGDLRSAESEEQKSILKSLRGSSDDSNIAEESRRDSIEIRVESDDEKKYPSYRNRKESETNKTYDVVQWFATPSRIVEHHTEGGEHESNIDSYNDNDNLNSQNSGYSVRNHDDDSYHVDHHHIDHHHNDHPNTDDSGNHYSSFHHQNNENDHDVPTSDVFYKKLKLKKVRRNCTRSKVKKIKNRQNWPEGSDINIESRSNAGIVLPHVNTVNLPQNLPTNSEARFNDIPKTLDYPAISSNAMGFSGEHLHGIPRTHFFHYKNGEGVNHYHLHNHNHIYDASGKRINIGYSPKYRNLAENFNKLKSMLTTADIPNANIYPHPNNPYRSTVSLGDSESKPSTVDSNGHVKTYPNAGSHENYDHKAYNNAYPSTKTTSSYTSNDDLDKSIGIEMYRYGAGQYGTDEFDSGEDKRVYPNEVKYEIDRPYTNSRENFDSTREKPFTSYQSSSYNGGYGNRNSYSSAESPYSSYNKDYDHRHVDYSHGGNENKYSQNDIPKTSFDPQDKAPYTPQDKAPYTPQDKAPYTPQDKTPFTPQDKIPYSLRDKQSFGPSSAVNGPLSAEVHDGLKGPQSDVFHNSNSYPHPYDLNEGKNDQNSPSSGKSEVPSSQENTGPKSIDVTHSVSYSQDGEIETVDLGPENLHLYKNLRPEPDPLTIPKNARVFEHYIRLHPMHYMYAAMARNPMNIPTAYGNLGYPVPIHKYPVALPKYPAVVPKYPAAIPKYPVVMPRYPVPLHKLMPNPLKMPAVLPTAPLHPRIPVAPQWNQMLYQGRALYHRWW